MDFPRPTAEVAPYALQALTTVARAARSGLARPQCALLEAAQQVWLETELDVGALEPIAPEELAARLDDPAAARALVRLMVATSLADGPPSLEQVGLASSFASALGVEEPSIGVVAHLARGRVLRFRIAFLRHSHIRQYLRNTRRMLGGLRPVIRAVLIAGGVLGEDAELSRRYRALGELPEGTLGREFFRHYTGEGLKFPGEKGGFPVGALFHDFSHVLAGYDTSPEGEMRHAAFQAGYTRHEDAFFTALFAIVIHTAGLNLTPFPMPVLRGRIGQAGLARDMLRELERGAAVKVDLGDGWDFWDYVALPIDVARAQLGIPSRQAA